MAAPNSKTALPELFQSMTVSVFRFSAAQVRWSQAELDQLQSLWTRAYKRAESLQNGTASDIFIFPKRWGGEELSTPINIIAQELCNNIRIPVQGLTFWEQDYGWGVRVRRHFGARGRSSVRYGPRLGDLQENWFLLFSN